MTAANELAFHSSRKREERKLWLEDFDTLRSAENWQSRLNNAAARI